MSSSVRAARSATRHRRYRTLTALACLGPIALGGCSDNDEVLFVTTSNIGLSFDAATQTANVALDRFEGIVAPVYKGGSLPPVVATLRSDGSYFVPAIDQTYATGDAAMILTDTPFETDSDDKKKCDADSVKDLPRCTGKLVRVKPKQEETESGGDKKPVAKKAEPMRRMFFGTSTSLGVTAALSTESPGTVNVGYKRRELSVIPMMPAATSGTEVSTTEERYAAVLATLKIDIDEYCNPKTPDGADTADTGTSGDDKSKQQTDDKKPTTTDNTAPAPAPAPVTPVTKDTTASANTPSTETAQSTAETAPASTTGNNTADAASSVPSEKTILDLKAYGKSVKNVCLAQLFATGGAARGLASQEKIQSLFQSASK